MFQLFSHCIEDKVIYNIFRLLTHCNQEKVKYNKIHTIKTLYSGYGYTEYCPIYLVTVFRTKSQTTWSSSLSHRIQDIIKYHTFLAIETLYSGYSCTKYCPIYLIIVFRTKKINKVTTGLGTTQF